MAENIAHSAEAAEALSLQPLVAKAIVCFTLFGIGEHFVRFADLFKTLLGSGIAGIAESDFLLGKIKNKPFKVTFTWLLDPENFAKVLSGRYRNEFDEYDQWLDGEPLPCSLTGETEDRDMTREERRRAIENLWNPQTPEKAEAARLLGLA